MPYINLGNIKSTLAGGGTLYTHAYNAGLKTHEFTGVGTLGFCKCVASYKSGDIIKLNNVEINVVNLPHYIIQNAYILFIAETDAMFIFNKAEYNMIPDGTIAPADDLATWCACAGLNYAELGSPDAQTLATATEYSTALFNSENAFKYYQRSSKIIKDTIVGTNTANLLNQHNLLYQTPAMASNNSPSGYTTHFVGFPQYSSDWGYPYNIFGRSFRVSDGNRTGNAATLTLPKVIWPYKMTWTPTTSGSCGGTLTIKWQASNDGNNWIDLDTVQYTNSAGTEVVLYNKAGQTEKYNTFRVYIHSATGNSSGWSTGYLYFYGFE